MIKSDDIYKVCKRFVRIDFELFISYNLRTVLTRAKKKAI